MRVLRVFRVISFLAVLTLAAAAGGARAAEGTAPPARKSAREELREQIKNLTPEERAARLKELREKSQPTRDEVDRRREMLKNLSPDERELKLKELRDRGGAARRTQEERMLALEEREARPKEVLQRVEQQLDTLRKKVNEGTISAEERVRLERLEKIYLRFEERAPRPPGGSPQPTKAAGKDSLPPNSHRNPSSHAPDMNAQLLRRSPKNARNQGTKTRTKTMIMTDPAFRPEWKSLEPLPLDSGS